MTKTLKNSHAIIIGVGNDLPESVQDAKSVYDILSNPKLAGYEKENIILLTDKLAIRKNIINAFKDLIARTDEKATVLLYYSGHGGTFTDNDLIASRKTGEPKKPDAENVRHYFLQPYDCTLENFEKTWVLARELNEFISELKSNRIILFLDCCHAEGMTQSGPEIAAPKLKDRLRNPEGLAQKIDNGKGMSFLTSCRAKEKSYILPGDTLSLFTTCLNEVLTGAHKSFFDEPFVRMTEVINYLMKKVPERKRNQRPFVNIQMYEDFIVSKLPKEKIHQMDTSAKIEPPVSKLVQKEIVPNFRERKTAVNAVLFVHGFSGEAASTFDALQNFIKEDPEMNGWDLFPLGYSENNIPQMGKGIWASVEDINRVADYLSASIKNKYGQYKRIAIIAHGLGGLAVQKSLTELEKSEMDKISHVLLFGTPSNGINTTASKLLDARWADLQKESPFIQTLRADWEKTFQNEYPFAFKVIAGTDDRDIAVTSIFEPFEIANQSTVAGNHYSMVQPLSKENDSYRLIVDTLSNNEFHNLYTNPEEINNLLGEYDAVVTKLLPIKDTLNTKGLKQLLFALEGLDKNEAVMNILLNHPLSQGNTDLMGIMGGRLKRKYLQSFVAADGEKAMEYYENALKLSVEKKDNEQIYYHAINLAFLSLVYKEDKTKMREYAAQAVAAAESVSIPSLWKTATLAEAALYNGDFEKAKDYYTLASEMAGIREKISIHTNAFMAYTSLMEIQEDDFTKFLKIKFLT